MTSTIGPPDDYTPMPTTAPTEPAVSTGGMVSLATLLVNGLVVFGVPLDTQQKVWIVGGISLIAPLIAAVLIRAKVFSPAAYDEAVDRLQHQIDTALRGATEVRSAAAAQRMAHEAALAAVQAAAVPAAAPAPSQFPDPPHRFAEAPAGPQVYSDYADAPIARTRGYEAVPQPTWESMHGYEGLPTPPAPPTYDTGDPGARFPDPPVPVRRGRHGMREG